VNTSNSLNAAYIIHNYVVHIKSYTPTSALCLIRIAWAVILYSGLCTDIQLCKSHELRMGLRVGMHKVKDQLYNTQPVQVLEVKIIPIR
jgi:hypothetical protein